jgi:hypothetical protein
LLLRMGENITQNMQRWFKNINKRKLLHLVGYLHHCINDARSHKHQVKKKICSNIHIFFLTIALNFCGNENAMRRTRQKKTVNHAPAHWNLDFNWTPLYICIADHMYEVQQFNSRNGHSVSLGCWVR